MIQTQFFLHREGTTPHDVFYSAGRAPLLTSVRGASLETAEDDDDDDNFADDDYTGDHYQTSLPSESLFSENVDDEDSESASIHSLNPVYHAGTSFWIWGPDGPLDQGGDPYMRTWNEWIQVVSPAVRHKVNTVTLTQQIHDI